MSDSTIKIIVPAGNATMGPPVGPALGQKGVAAKEFCDQFNKMTAHLPKGTPLHVHIYVDAKKKFKISFMECASTTALIKAELKIQGGLKKPGLDQAIEMNKTQLEKIARQKMGDTSSTELEMAMKIVAGTAKSMGIKVIL